VPKRQCNERHPHHENEKDGRDDDFGAEVEERTAATSMTRENLKIAGVERQRGTRHSSGRSWFSVPMQTHGLSLGGEILSIPYLLLTIR
jgi:hypothetical protein